MKLPERDPCPMCEVVGTGSWTLEGEKVEAAVVAVTDDALALLSDYSVDGYAFVIPKRHAPTILDLRPDESHAVMDLLVELSRAISGELAPEGSTSFRTTEWADIKVSRTFTFMSFPDGMVTCGRRPSPNDQQKPWLRCPRAGISPIAWRRGFRGWRPNRSA